MPILIDRTQLCQSFGAPDCEAAPDPEFTMNYDDIGEDPIYFCSTCGPIARQVSEALYRQLEADPGLADKLQEMFDELNATRKAQSS